MMKVQGNFLALFSYLFIDNVPKWGYTIFIV